MEYLLKWQGYGEGFNTWEPKDNLNCPTLIAKYKEEIKKKKGTDKLAPSKRLLSGGTHSKKSVVADKKKKNRPKRGENASVSNESSEVGYLNFEIRQRLVYLLN